MQDIPDPRPRRTRDTIQRDIAWYRQLRDAERDAGHEGAAIWYEAQVDDLLGEWVAAE